MIGSQHQLTSPETILNDKNDGPDIQMIVAAFYFALVWLLISATDAIAMDKTDTIDTNRPSFMFSPLVVPRSSVQLENGTLERRSPHRLNSFDLTETQLRVGLTERTEFQMFVPNVFFMSGDEGATRTRVTELGEVGFKHQLPPLRKFQLSLIPSVDIPIGTNSPVGHGVHPVFRAPYSYPLTETWSLMGMQSVALYNSGRDINYQPNVMLQKNFGTKLSVFSEYVGFFTRHEPTIQFAHFGGEYRPKRNHQIDMHFGFGLDKPSPSAFVGAGYSYRFDKLNW